MVVDCDSQRPWIKLIFGYLKDRATRDPVLQERHKPGATLKGKKICEASHGAMFLAISLRGKDGTPWQGVAYTLPSYKGQRLRSNQSLFQYEMSLKETSCF